MTAQLWSAIALLIAMIIAAVYLVVVASQRRARMTEAERKAEDDLDRESQIY